MDDSLSFEAFSALPEAEKFALWMKFKTFSNSSAAKTPSANSSGNQKSAMKGLSQKLFASAQKTSSQPKQSNTCQTRLLQKLQPRIRQEIHNLQRKLRRKSLRNLIKKRLFEKHHHRSQSNRRLLQTRLLRNPQAQIRQKIKIPQ